MSIHSLQIIHCISFVWISSCQFIHANSLMTIYFSNPPKIPINKLVPVTMSLFRNLRPGTCRALHSWYNFSFFQAQRWNNRQTKPSDKDYCFFFCEILPFIQQKCKVTRIQLVQKEGAVRMQLHFWTPGWLFSRNGSCDPGGLSRWDGLIDYNPMLILNTHEILRKKMM